MLFHTTKFSVLCYTDNRKLIRYVMKPYQNSLNWVSDSQFIDKDLESAELWNVFSFS